MRKDISMRSGVVVLLSLVVAAFGYGQKCQSEGLLHHKLTQSATLHAAFEQQQENIQSYIRQHPNLNPAREVVQVPVVVHVVWRTPEQNISDAQVISQIEVLNHDFRALNADLGAVPFIFQPAIGDLELEFFLADIDPEGNATSGITRTETTVLNIGDRFTGGRRSICHTDLGGADAWCPDEYINIWVGELSAGLAVTSFPNMDPIEEDGIRIEPQVFGTTGSVMPPYHLGRTLTHELGHFFNLFHLWGDALECTTDDGVEDTPLQADWYLNTCPTTPQFSCDSPDMYMNFLNFTDDACMNMFTKGQKARVWATLNGPRIGLLEGNNCGMVSTAEPPLPEITVFPNPTAGRLQLDFSQKRPISAQLIDSQGKVMEEWSFGGQKTEEIMLKDCPDGIYFIIFVFKDMYLSKKLILMQ